MKKINSIAILFIFILSLSTCACTKRNTEDISNDTNQNNNISQNTNENQKLSKEEYKKLLVKNYEKYISPIDIRDEKLDDILDKNNNLNNEELIANYKNLLSDSKNNVKSFEDSIKKVKVEDSNIQNLNDELVLNLNKVIEDITIKEDSLNSISDDLINGDKNILINYLDDELGKDTQNEESLDRTFDQLESLLGIKFE
ncbi:MAG: hypothetical protein E7E21_12250 [Peptostreptococcaceae bacterium]|nr:hypothetical protein [Peptostreptococcaceae bacterium]